MFRALARPALARSTAAAAATARRLTTTALRTAASKSSTAWWRPSAYQPQQQQQQLVQPRRSFQIRSLDDVKLTDDITHDPKGQWESHRFYKREHGLTHSVHWTVLYAGSSMRMQYKNHQEVVMIIQGTGNIEVLEDGQEEGQGMVYLLKPGTCYALDNADLHILRVDEGGDMIAVCTFDPALTGKEVHGDDGAYPLDS